MLAPTGVLGFFYLIVTIVTILLTITMVIHIHGLTTSIAGVACTELSNDPLGVLQSQAEQDIDKCIRGKQTQDLLHDFHSRGTNPTLHSSQPGLAPHPHPNPGALAFAV